MKPEIRSAAILALCFVLAVALLTTIHWLNQSKIAESEQAMLMRSLTAVLPPEPFDNDPVSSRRRHTAPALGSSEPLDLYVVFNNQQPLAAVVEIVAPDGYNGDIRILLGIHYDGRIIGARVIEHRETPGLADDMEVRRSNWILNFKDRSLSQSEAIAWDVKARGGQFDAFTGATITPRAIIRSIYSALQWYEQNREFVFNP